MKLTPSGELWMRLPELVRNYPEDKRADAREHAYRLFHKFSLAEDHESIGRLAFALESQEDLGSTFRLREWA